MKNNRSRSYPSSVSFTLLLLISSGCAQPKATLAHDKPLSYWVESLRDPDVKLRSQAAKVLGNIGPADGSVIPALSNALRDPDAGVRKEAIFALTKFGPKASDALPALEGAQRDEDARIRVYAEKAIKTIHATP